MKKPTQAEEITKLNARVAKLEFDSKYQQDMDAMKAMEERFTPLPPEHNNNWAIIAMVIAFIALISAISISGYYKADMDRYAVALNKRILVLESAKADPKPASKPCRGKRRGTFVGGIHINGAHTLLDACHRRQRYNFERVYVQQSRQHRLGKQPQISGGTEWVSG